jgi:molybdenum cofactor biosynthesis enzyme MoaA
VTARAVRAVVPTTHLRFCKPVEDHVTYAITDAVKRSIKNTPAVATLARNVYNDFEMLRHSVADQFPRLIRPRRHRITMAVTALCNARCVGCRYGRDFMPGQVLPLDVVYEVLEDASACGFSVVRLYGGEPLLHKDLPHMVRRCRELQLKPYVTTNGVLLDRKIEALFEAGLRDITIGFYGLEDDYDRYVQIPGLFRRLERSIAKSKDMYGGELSLQMNWLLHRSSCSVETFHKVCAFAQRYEMSMQIDLIHYSLPYFQEGPDRMLQFRPEDRPMIEDVVRAILRTKLQKPWLITASLPMLRSIPDWLLKGPQMKVPCTAYEMVWIGADGTVQLCYVAFPLGNLRHQRLREMLTRQAYKQAARDAFQLNCPNCHCSANDRIMRHRQSRAQYSIPWEREDS